MSVTRRISDNRATLTLVCLVVFSLVSMASGAQAQFIGNAVRAVASLVTHPFIIAFDRIGEGAGNVTWAFSEYSRLKAENDQLQWELATMQQQVVSREEAAIENRRLRSMLAFEQRHPRLELMPAQVGAVYKGGVMTIYRGSIHGVRKGMWAITEDGIVGVITQVDPLESSVNTLHHQNCSVGVRIKRNRVTGVVHGSGNALTHVCELQYIQVSDDVKVGDELVTSVGSNFPSVFPVGRVISIQGGDTLLRTAWVQPAVNIYALDQVFVVLSAQPPQDVLTASTSDTTPLARAHAMPDTRSIQERLAP